MAAFGAAREKMKARAATTTGTTMASVEMIALRAEIEMLQKRVKELESKVKFHEDCEKVERIQRDFAEKRLAVANNCLRAVSSLLMEAHPFAMGLYKAENDPNYKLTPEEKGESESESEEEDWEPDYPDDKSSAAAWRAYASK
jgi:hypothetical protein